MTAAQVWALIGLGAFHGLNPGMGWLFAVAIGLQERSRASLLRALGPIAAGHLASIAVVAIAVDVGISALTSRAVAIAGGALMVGVGMWRLLSKRHFRWVGMRLNAVQLAGWSFLMASVHGAGLMLIPVLAQGGSHSHEVNVPAGIWNGTVAALVHTAGTLVVAAGIALLVYEFLGLKILRSAWINLDSIWAMVLLAAGTATVLTALL